MQKPVTRLYPLPGDQCALEGLYLQHQLHRRGEPGTPFVYSNFITSLDGRVAVATSDHATHTVPSAIGNPRDWRLYQELAGQADLLITSGRFYRQSMLGEAQDVLPVDNGDQYADIREWRQDQGLPAQPDIAIISGSLDIPLPALQSYRDRRLLVITGAKADRDRADRLRENGIEVIHAGEEKRVDGRLMLTELATRGYQSIYAIAGPAVFYTLLEAQVLDRLYLTIAQQLLGGDVYDTLTSGPLLAPARGMQLVQLYHDSHAPAGAGQLLGCFEPAGQGPG